MITSHRNTKDRRGAARRGERRAYVAKRSSSDWSLTEHGKHGILKHEEFWSETFLWFLCCRIVGRFFEYKKALCLKRNGSPDLFVISSPQLEAALHEVASWYRYLPTRFCSFSGIWLTEYKKRNLTSRISSCRVEGFDRPFRGTSSSTCGHGIWGESDWPTLTSLKMCQYTERHSIRKLFERFQIIHPDTLFFPWIRD